MGPRTTSGGSRGDLVEVGRRRRPEASHDPTAFAGSGHVADAAAVGMLAFGHPERVSRSGIGRDTTMGRLGRNPHGARARLFLLLVLLVGLLGVAFAGAILAIPYVGGVVVVVGWCAWLCSAVHVLQRSGNRRRGQPYPDRLMRHPQRFPVHEGQLAQPARPAVRPDQHRLRNVDWRATRARFAQLRTEYAQFECDPLAVVRLPALTDVTVASTGRFVDAFAEAQALDTDTEPPGAHGARFASAVDHAWRCWRAARDAAERIRLSAIPADERIIVQRAIKLLTMARESHHDTERAAAYAKARRELAKLERSGTLALPPAAAAALSAATRGQLPSARTQG